jgi:peptidoglycan/LPS O-acetylase OafA/YrhL
LATSPFPHLKYRPDIDGLRAVAVLAVVGYHAFPAIFPGGLIGVDVFFVISGFLITGIIVDGLDNGTFSFAEFYRRRIRRIFPALAVVLAACLVAGWFLLLPDEFARLGKHAAAGAGFVLNFVLWGEAGYFDKAAVTKPLLHLWSLGVEEQFYIAWPLLLFATGRARLPLIWLVGILLAVSFVISIMLGRSDAVMAFYSPVTRFWELMSGGLLALAVRRSPSGGTKPNAAMAHLRSLLGMVAIAIPVFLLDDKSTFPGWWALLPVVGAYLIISAGPDAWINRVLSWRGLVAIGLISYPLYLWHWPLLSFLTIAQSQTPPVVWRIVAVLVSVGLAWATYRFVEKPVRFGAARETKAYGSVAAIVALGAIGIFIDHQEGFTGRAIVAQNMATHNTTTDDTPLSRYLAKLAADPNYLQKLDDQRSDKIRIPYCHMDASSATFADFRPTFDRCLAIDSSRKNVLVLGDSHAADVYTALVSAYPEINFLQSTGAGCTPISSLGTTRACKDMLEYTLSYLASHPVDAVVIEAIWPPDYAWISLELSRIKGLGIKIMLIGPPLTFTAEVPKIVERRPADTAFAPYIASRIDVTKRTQEQEMAQFAQSNGLDYLPYIAVYCDNGNCPVLNNDGDLLILDQNHLTYPGAVYFGQRVRQAHLLEKTLGE